MMQCCVLVLMAESTPLPELKNAAKKHLRNLGGVDRMVFIRQNNFTIAYAALRDGRVAVGATLRSEEDNFDESYGRVVAVTRLQPVQGEVAW